MGRPFKPTHLKIIQGTDRADRMVEEGATEAYIETPPAMDWLPNAHAVKEWHRLAPILVANKLLNDGNIGAFAQLCALYGKMVQEWSAGNTPHSKMITHYRQLMSDFGLTPASSGRVMAAKQGGKSYNRFGNNGTR